jgi:protein-S-isoprenylcysteine O-methyltransferase Ste14
MTEQSPAYGLWGLVVLNSIIFIFFAFTFFKPQTKRDWRSFGTFSAFLVALFAEMYGFPLSIYILSGWLQNRYPGVDWLSHDAGHLLEMIFGWRANPHLGPFHVLSFALIGAGFILISAAWRVLYEAQRHGTLATSGPYDYVRHPQYVGFILVLAGFLIQWPTLLTLAMFPVLVVMYVRLARQEEVETRAAFGPAYDAYADRVPAFVLRWSRLAQGTRLERRVRQWRKQ